MGRTTHASTSGHEPDLVVSGTVENQGHFYHYFEHVVLISAPLHVLLERVGKRKNKPYGNASQQQVEIEHYAHTVEPLLRRKATLELDGRRPTSELADVIESLQVQQ